MTTRDLVGHMACSADTAACLFSLGILQTPPTTQSHWESCRHQSRWESCKLQSHWKSCKHHPQLSLMGNLANVTHNSVSLGILQTSPTTQSHWESCKRYHDSVWLAILQTSPTTQSHCKCISSQEGPAAAGIKQVQTHFKEHTRFKEIIGGAAPLESRIYTGAL